MMSKVRMLALTLGFVLFVGSNAFANQLLVNPNFDNGINLWNNPNFGTGFSVSDSIYHSGPYSASSLISDLNDNDYSELSQSPAVTVGQNVYATAYVKTNISPLSTAKAGIKIQFYNGANQPIANPVVQSEIGGQTDWRLLYVAATAPATAESVRFTIYKFAANGDQDAIDGIAYFDDCVVSTDYITPPLNSNLYNAGFENGLNDWANLFGFPGTLSESIYHSGNLAVAKDIQHINNQDYFSRIYQLVNFNYAQDGDVYATVYVRTNFPIQSTSNKAGLELEFLDINGSVIAHPRVFHEVGVTNGWQRLYAQDLNPPSNAVKIRVSGYVYSSEAHSVNGGIAYFDDFVYSTTPLPQSNFQTTVLNPGFESGIADWFELYGFPSTVNTTITHNSSTASAQKTISVLDPPRDYYSQIYQDIYANASGTPFATGTNVYATAYVKTIMSPMAKSNAGLQFEFIDASGNVIEDAQNNPIVVNDSIGGNTDWRYLYVHATTPAGTAKVRVSGFIFAPLADASLAGDAYFDDFTFSLSALPLPPVQETLINANFENGLNDWDLVYSPGLRTDNAIYHDGSYSAKATIDTDLDINFYASASQDLHYPYADPTGHPVYATVYVRTAMNPASSARAGFITQFFNAAGTFLGQSGQQLSGNNDWRRLVVDGVVPPAGTATVRVITFALANDNDVNADGAVANFDGVTFSYTPFPPEGFRTELINAGFENGLTDWSEAGGFPGVVSGDAHTGVNSAQKNIGVIPNQSYYSQIYQDIYYDNVGSEYPANTNVYATAYAKTRISPITKSKAGLQLEFINEDGEVIEDANEPIIVKSSIGGLTNWRYLYVTGQVPAGTVRVRVSGTIFARQQDASRAGSAYFDDFQFSRTPLALPLPVRNLINPGFENGLNDWDELNKPGEVSAIWSNVAPGDAHSGTYSSYFTVDGTLGGDYFGTASQDISINPNSGIVARVWVKTNINFLSNASANLSLAFFDANGHQVGTEVAGHPIGGRSRWTRIDILTIAPPSAVKLRFICSLYAPQGDVFAIGGRAIFDDAFLTAGGTNILPDSISASDGPTITRYRSLHQAVSQGR